MDVVLLGTGSPLPDPNRAGPATLVEGGGRRVLVDAGRAVLMRAAAVGVAAAALDAVLLTHLHSDHLTDLSDVITTRWITGLVPAPLTIVGPPGTGDLVDGILTTLASDIGYRIAHHEDLERGPDVEVVEVTEGPCLSLDGMVVTAGSTDHRPVAPTVAYRVEADGTSVVVAGDTVPCAGLDDLARGAGALVHTVIRRDLVEQVPLQRFRDILDYHSSVEQAADTAARAGVGTLVLTHYVPPLAPGDEATWRTQAAGCFGGRVELGDDLHRVTVGWPPWARPGRDVAAVPSGWPPGRVRVIVTEGNADPVATTGPASVRPRWRAWLPAVGGVVALAVALILRPDDARAAAAQDWSPFVLVAGLLLVGLVADGDELFAAAGHQLSVGARRGVVLYVGAAVVVGVVTALLNLDTAVAFLTPVLVAAARTRNEPDGALLYGCLLLANAGSLFLPGSNLTNLIVLGHLHLSGGAFLAHMWAPALAALVVTALVVGVRQRRTLRASPPRPDGPGPPFRAGVGLVAVAAVTVLVVVLRAPALPVLVVGVVATGVRVVAGRGSWRGAMEVVGPSVLVALFGVAVAMGTLGRSWDGPERLLAHLDLWGVGFLAAATSVVVNNLPAASLLAARTPPHPFALLVGLNVGPNLFVTGSLAWVLWLRVARRSGAAPSVRTAAGLGALAVPLAMVAALGLLALTGAG